MSVAASASPGRSTRFVVLALTMGVLAGAVAFITWQLRSYLRDQVLRREAESLAAVASLELANGADELAPLGVADAPGEVFAAVLKASQLRDVLGIRVFDPDRHFSDSVPAGMPSDQPPSDADWAQLVAGETVARLHPRENLAALDGLIDEPKAGEPAIPVLEAWVPLRKKSSAALAGAAQFWIDGRRIAAEFAALDRNLALQAILAWAAGAAVIGFALGWAFRRLAAANDALRLRSDDLQRANRELVLAAKTSALGAVTAHLIHEIKNPIAGLEIFVANQAETGPRPEGGGELAAATELTRRLRAMVNDVVDVLRDEQHGADFELSAGEIAEIALGKTRDAAAARNLSLTTDVTSRVPLPARRANLASLVLRNLLQNAVEATPPGGTVRLAARDLKDGTVEFSVSDQGAGLPEAVRERLFQPCTSSKPGGSGLGLALSHQLAVQAGGRLELVGSGAQGTSFRLVLAPEA